MKALSLATAIRRRGGRRLVEADGMAETLHADIVVDAARRTSGAVEDSFSKRGS